jgi:SAM-dependent methyltransferase
MPRNDWVRGGCWGRPPAPRARLPWLLCRRRTVRGVAAYFDLITEDGRLSFGDSFHFGFFPGGWQSLAQALDAHTDLVCELAGIRPGMRVLDVGCGIGEPTRRIASRIDCEIVGLNISCEQVRQGRELIARAGLAARVDIRHGNALYMPLPDGGFDAAICLEVGSDIRVRGGQAAAARGAAPGAAPRRAGRFQRSGVRPAADRGRGPGAARSAVPLGPGAADRLAGPVRRRRVPAGNGA